MKKLSQQLIKFEDLASKIHIIVEHFFHLNEKIYHLHVN